MTREEALEILDRLPTIGEQVDALEMAIEALEQSQWIPCSEQLPKEDGHYLCTVIKPQYIDEIFVKFAYWCGRWYGWHQSEITAWMPLPKPYKGGE